jgi:hypothetical protein
VEFNQPDATTIPAASMAKRRGAVFMDFKSVDAIIRRQDAPPYCLQFAAARRIRMDNPSNYPPDFLRKPRPKA